MGISRRRYKQLTRAAGTLREWEGKFLSYGIVTIERSVYLCIRYEFFEFSIEKTGAC